MILELHKRLTRIDNELRIARAKPTKRELRRIAEEKEHMRFRAKFGNRLPTMSEMFDYRYGNSVRELAKQESCLLKHIRTLR